MYKAPVIIAVLFKHWPGWTFPALLKLAGVK